MLEYHEIMLRPNLYPGGRIHHDPERQGVDDDRPPLPPAADVAAARKYSACLKALVLAVFGGALIVGALHGVVSDVPDSAMQAAAGS